MNKPIQTEEGGDTCPLIFNLDSFIHPANTFFLKILSCVPLQCQIFLCCWTNSCHLKKYALLLTSSDAWHQYVLQFAVQYCNLRTSNTNRSFQQFDTTTNIYLLTNYFGLSRYADRYIIFSFKFWYLGKCLNVINRSECFRACNTDTVNIYSL